MINEEEEWPMLHQGLSDIRSMATHFKEVVFAFQPREGNEAADRVAKEALSFMIDAPKAHNFYSESSFENLFVSFKFLELEDDDLEATQLDVNRSRKPFPLQIAWTFFSICTGFICFQEFQDGVRASYAKGRIKNERIFKLFNVKSNLCNESDSKKK
ncbi:unnamed protein product [Microthlaspi erraticum]|uniref:RNase H type-1 domain-containing protein n=1 Tax=Microthlaspi erraticum TaxID=1685480 RepID=A0A6D2IV83_9BRAS|nr:unnamed protein product [Microthlaspi erraticum]